MKRLLLFALASCCLAAAGCSGRAALKKELRQALATAVEQEKAQAVRMAAIEGKLPRTFEKGEVQPTSPYNWVSGFFPGSLWLLYEHTGDEELKSYADMFTRGSRVRVPLTAR